MELIAHEVLRLDFDPQSLLPMEWKLEGNQHGANASGFYPYLFGGHLSHGWEPPVEIFGEQLNMAIESLPCWFLRIQRIWENRVNLPSEPRCGIYKYFSLESLTLILASQPG